MARCDSYAFGNCTWECCRLAPWIPEWLGDGGDWAGNYLLQGGQVTDIPTAGAVVSYCRGDGYSQYGHCAFVEQVYDDGTFLVTEMNFVAFDLEDQRVSTTADVCGFLLAPGAIPGTKKKPGQGGPPPGGVDGIPNSWHDAWNAVVWWTNTGSVLEHGYDNGNKSWLQSIQF